MIKAKHGGVKIHIYIHNLMAACGLEESISVLQFPYLCIGDKHLLAFLSF